MMKKHISVFMLLVRSSIWKVLLILSAMAISQILLFFVLGAGEEVFLLDALEQIPFLAVVCVGVILLTCVLCIPLSDRGGKMNNLILRLGLTERRIFWLQVVYNALVYCLFIMVQALTMLLLSLIYSMINPGTMDPMAIFVTSYQHPLFHCFFPLHNAFGWVSNLVLVLGIGICTAAYPMRQRHRFNSFSTILMVLVTIGYWLLQNESGGLEFDGFAMVSVGTIFLVFISLYGVMTMEVDSDGKT